MIPYKFKGAGGAINAAHVMTYMHWGRATGSYSRKLVHV